MEVGITADFRGDSRATPFVNLPQIGESKGRSCVNVTHNWSQTVRVRRCSGNQYPSEGGHRMEAFQLTY
jgi:hypothetical protein